MSAAEWAAGRCNELCQGGNFPGACAVINVGSASRVGSVVGMAERQKWFKLITHVFSQYENVLQSPVPPPSGPNDPAPHESMNWPRLRRRPPGEHRWYDVVTRWFRPREEPIEIPAVIAHPELAEHNTDAGDPTFRHDTDRRD